ncbi:hypothetical protein VNO80_01214 [Phaseolus coccineus]|uniref:NB-ARC domain-containing protein n=1 Tax=Phaseolus coccineus TaxID=3886 RepID=A0AAN9P4N4_PHACN
MDMLTTVIVNGSYDGINSFPKEGLLPPSLTSLRLFGLSSMETLECKGLLHLTSLQELRIQNCEKLENIAGERLPVSLVKLSIEKCPLLEKRCHRKDSEIWAKMCHVRGIKIDGNNYEIHRDHPSVTAPIGHITQCCKKLYTYAVIIFLKMDLDLSLSVEKEIELEEGESPFHKALGAQYQSGGGGFTSFSSNSLRNKNQTSRRKDWNPCNSDLTVIVKSIAPNAMQNLGE